MTSRDLRVFALGAAVATAVALIVSYCGSSPPEPSTTPTAAEPVVAEDPDAGADAMDGAEPESPADQARIWRRGAGVVPLGMDAGSGDAAVDDGGGADASLPPQFPSDLGRELSRWHDGRAWGRNSEAVWGVALDHGVSLVSPTAGAIIGRVRFRGEAPPPEERAVGSKVAASLAEEAEFCRKHLVARPPLAVNAYGHLADAVVRITWGMDAKPGPDRVAAIEIKDCAPSPAINVAVANQSVRLINKDSVSHSFDLMYQSRGDFQKALGPGESRDFAVPKPGAMAIRLLFGDSSGALVMVVPDPYYSVTDRFGEFAIPLVPPGTYTLTAWHPRLGKKDQLVIVVANHETEMNFDFGPSDFRR